MIHFSSTRTRDSILLEFGDDCDADSALECTVEGAEEISVDLCNTISRDAFNERSERSQRKYQESHLEEFTTARFVYELVVLHVVTFLLAA